MTKKKTTIASKIIICLWIIGMLVCILCVRNPFFIQKIDASQNAQTDYEAIYQSKHPYVYMTNMDLTYTGYFGTNNDQITSYCFVANIGSKTFYVFLDAAVVEKKTLDVESGLQSVSVLAQLTNDDTIAQLMAAEEGMTQEAYEEEYQVSSICINQYNNDYEQVIICYILAVLLLIFILVSLKIWDKKAKESEENI